MAYNRIEVKNFQSLKDVSLDLGKFTLVTGESHSGKSAFMRAFIAAASNIIGTGDIKSGAADMSVTLISETHKVTLYRTVKGRGDYYKVVDLATGSERDFHTLGVGGVPEEVTDALKIEPIRKGTPSVNFHVQMDPPYLLTATGSQVARELGELTNVTEIFEAVREATRQLKGLNADLKSRQKDLDAAIKQAQQFRDLTAKDAALTRAEQALDRARSIKQRAEILDASLQALGIAGQILDRVVPSTEHLSRKLAEVEALENLLKVVRLSQRIELEAIDKLENALGEQERLHEEQHALLMEMGECPTCGTKLKGGSSDTPRSRTSK